MVSVKNVETITTNERVFIKRECVFSDESRACRLVESGKCYDISNLYVKAYSGQ